MYWMMVLVRNDVITYLFCVCRCWMAMTESHRSSWVRVLNETKTAFRIVTLNSVLLRIHQSTCFVTISQWLAYALEHPVNSPPFNDIHDKRLQADQSVNDDEKMKIVAKVRKYETRAREWMVTPNCISTWEITRWKQTVAKLEWN